MKDEAYLDDLLRSGGIRLGAAQRDRLGWLVGQYGPATLREADEGRRDSGVVIVSEPPSGAAAELFYRSLHPACAVVIPFSENPGFDFVKSKLTEFGTVGPCGAEGPHEMWWGGIGWSKFALAAEISELKPRVVSCSPRNGDRSADALRGSAEKLQLDYHIEAIPTEFDDRVLCFEKAEFLLRMWARYREPLLFVEARAVLREPPLLPSFLGCDVALHRWNRWEMSARTIYLGRTSRAEQLLRTWHQLAASYPSIWDGYLLDQAWSLTSSQGPLDTVWLPRTYHALNGDLAASRATIVHDQQTTTVDLGPDPAFAQLVRAARRAGRTGARDAFMIMTSDAAVERGIAVILRDIAASRAGAVAETIQAVTSAFAADCGGYGRCELSLCAWQEDVCAARQAAESARYRILEIAPGAPISGDFFASLAIPATAAIAAT